MNATPSEKRGASESAWPMQTFLKIAGILTIVQAAIGLTALAWISWHSYDAKLNFVEQTLKVKLTEFANEIEQRAFPPGAKPERVFTLSDLPSSLVLDMSTRFPDPIVLLDTEGRPLRTIQPDRSVFKHTKASPVVVTPPPQIKRELLRDRVTVSIRAENNSSRTSWASAPVYNADGRLVGGIMIQPLTNSISGELGNFRATAITALIVVLGLSILSGLLLSAFITKRYIQQRS